MAIARILFIIFLCAINLSAKAQDDDLSKKAEIHAQEIIDACWSISLDDRASTNTDRQRYGALDSALCMERAILSLVSRYLNKGDQEKFAEYKKNIGSLRDDYGHMIWNLYNENDGCRPSCGTAFFSTHNYKYAHLLEEILKDMIKQIFEYQLDDDFLGAGILIDKNSNVINGKIEKKIPEKKLSICYSRLKDLSCGAISIRQIHGIYALEGLQYHTNDEDFISIKGFITKATDSQISLRGTIEINNTLHKSHSCTQDGDLTFDHNPQRNTWDLKTKNLQCAKDAKIYLKAVP